MRIFISCLQSRRAHQIPAYQYWETYFKRGIEEAGHRWVEAEGVDWAEALAHRSESEGLQLWMERTWPATVAEVRRAVQGGGVDVFLAYLYPHMVDHDAIREIQAMGVPCVNYFCDNVREFVRVPTEFAGFDLHWVPELKATRMYAAAGWPFVHAAMPTWVPPAQRTCDHAETHGVSFIGSRDAQREVLFARALELGADIELRGAGWAAVGTSAGGPADAPMSAGGVLRTVRNQLPFVRRHGLAGLARKVAWKARPRVSDETFARHVRARPGAEEYIEITQGSRVTLGVNRYPSYRYPFDRPDTYSRGRDVEAPMMGACYLTEWTEELEVMYDLGREIETYRTAEDMVEKIRSLEGDPARRRALRCAGQRRALADHSVPASLERMRDALGLGS